MAMLPFDEVNPNTQRAMPAIFSNLRDEPGLTERDRMRGAFKFAWSKNTRMLHDLRPVLEQMRGRGIDYRLIKGAAVQARCDRVGARVMGDVDILISARDVTAVEIAFTEGGFRRNGHSYCSGHSDAVHFDSLNFNKSGSHVDVHVAEYKEPTHLLRAMLDTQATAVAAAGTTILVPSAELLALHAAVHGALSSGETDLMQAALDLAVLRPIIDTRLLRQSAIDTRTLLALHRLDTALSRIGIRGSGVTPSTADLTRAEVASRVERTARLAAESNSVIRRIRDRQRGEEALSAVAARFPGHRHAYGTWLRSGQFAIAERQAARRWGGFLSEPEGTWHGDEARPFLDRSPGMIGSPIAAQALDWRFRVRLPGPRRWMWLDINSPALDRLDAFVFSNGTPITRIVAGDRDSRRIGIRGVSIHTEISIRPLWTTCRECYSGLDDLTITLVPDAGVA
jgi:hypothetical protein